MMKKLIFTLATSTILIAFVFTSCNNTAKNAEDSKNALLKAADDLNNAKQAYLLDVENYRKEILAKIEKNKLFINDFKIKMKNESADVKAIYEKQIDLLEERNNAMKLKLDAYQINEKDDWRKFKTEFNHDMDELGKAFSDLTIKNVN